MILFSSTVRFIRSGALEHHVRIGTMSNLCSTQQYGHVITQRSSLMRASKFLSRWKQYYLCLMSQLSVSTLPLSLSYSSNCACTCRQAGFRAGRSAQVELHRDDGGPSEERDEEGGVVTLGASAGRCPGPATAAEVEPRLLRTYGACERAVETRVLVSK